MTVQLKCKPTTAVYNILKRYQQYGSVENVGRSGRHSSLYNRNRKHIVPLVNTNCRSTLIEITNVFNENKVSQVCEQYVWRKLFQEDYGRRIAKKIRIREIYKRKHIMWCRRERRKTIFSTVLEVAGN